MADEVPQTRQTSRALPRWPALVMLIAAVLSAHLLLLTGGLPQFSASAATQRPLAPAAQTSEERSTPQGEHAATSVMHTSTVRWIVPPPPATPEPAKPRLADPPKTIKPAAKAAAPKPIAPAAVEPAPARVEESRAQAAEETAAAPSVEPEVVVAEAPPAEPTPPAAADPAPPAAPGTAGSPLPPAQPPASTSLQYVVAGQAKGFHYSATGTLDWELAGDRYSARMEMRMPLLGSRVQTSTGAVGPEGLRPERFADKGRSERAAHFEREQQRIRFSANTPEAELMPGAQDRLSLFLQIAGLLQASPQTYATGHIIELQVAGTGDAEIWRFQVGEESMLTLPAGEVRVRHLVRQPRKEFDSTVEMWLAPEFNHLPVRLKVTQANGDMADQQLAQKP